MTGVNEAFTTYEGYVIDHGAEKEVEHLRAEIVGGDSDGEDCFYCCERVRLAREGLKAAAGDGWQAQIGLFADTGASATIDARTVYAIADDGEDVGADQ